MKKTAKKATKPRRFPPALTPEQIRDAFYEWVDALLDQMDAVQLCLDAGDTDIALAVGAGQASAMSAALEEARHTIFTNRWVRAKEIDGAQLQAMTERLRANV